MRNQVHYVLQLLSLLRFHLVVFSVSSLSLLILSWKLTVCPKLYVTESFSKGAQNNEDLDLPGCIACSSHSIFGSDHSFFLHLEGSSWGHWGTSPSSRKCPVHPDLLLSAYCQLFLGTLPPIPLQCFIINLSHIRSHIPSNFYILWSN